MIFKCNRLSAFFFRTLLVTVALITIPSLAVAQSVSTIPEFTGSSWELQGNVTTVGQTISLSTPQDLTNFAFDISAYGTQGNPFNISVTPYVYAWNGSTVTGPSLFTGAPVTITGTESGAYQLYNVSTGQVLLNPGEYALFFNSTEPNLGYDNPLWGASTGYTGGGMIFDDDSGNFNSLADAAWTGTGQAGRDLAFTAALSPAAIPEPASLLLVMIGFFATGTRRRNCLSRK